MQIHYLTPMLSNLADTAPLFHLELLENWLSLVLAILVLGILDSLLFILFKRIASRVGLLAGEILALLAWLFGLTALSIMFASAVGCFIIILFLTNPNEGRDYIANNLIGKPRVSIFRSKKKKPESLFDRDKAYHTVEKAVISMAKRKVGALLTFEKKDDLDEIVKKSGTIINCPITSEIIETIFFPGTRLHDGAVIIRDQTIYAAAVFFTPTNRPLTGKYGSRHRAAIGISEVCDAVTVVVSEETGRISIAYQGQLRTVPPDQFFEIFEECMLSESNAEKESA